MASKKSRTQENVGKKIKKLRTDKKITLNQMANETGFSIDNIEKIESGEKHPSVGELLQISKALEIDSSFLLREQSTSADALVNSIVGSLALLGSVAAATSPS